MWYVIWTETGKEDDAAKELAEHLSPEIYRGCWVPKRVERQKRHGALVNVEKALFPGYFFLDCDDPLPVITIMHRLERFRLLLKSGDCYQPISREDEQLIRRLTDRNGKLNVSLIRVNEGQLRVVDGPLKNLEQYITKLNLHKRKVLVEMELFDQKHSFWAAVEII
ncbi:MAG: hypothetical protein IK115_02260 [Lachnospiraceae bacterium]|nr:hypothetical protein [Lachnospiraceae bacterium]